jgi:hypothetical protein
MIELVCEIMNHIKLSYIQQRQVLQTTMRHLTNKNNYSVYTVYTYLSHCNGGNYKVITQIQLCPQHQLNDLASRSAYYKYLGHAIFISTRSIQIWDILKKRIL